jgi:hypothetical protein
MNRKIGKENIYVEKETMGELKSREEKKNYGKGKN